MPGGIVGLLGKGVGIAAEYREHRKQQKISRENSQQDVSAIARPSSRPEMHHSSYSSSSDLPPANSDVAHSSGKRSLGHSKSASDEQKTAPAHYEDEKPHIEDDEEDWKLDDAIERADPPSYEDSERIDVPVDELVRDVVMSNRAALAAAPNFDRTPLPMPVILPQRRPRNKKRGFVRAYAPLLGECSGIDQATFLRFLKNFHKSSQASPIFPAVQIAAAIAGVAPSVIAMAVTTAVQIGAQVGEEVQFRQRTNTFLDKMNEELFKPAGLYAMIVKYKSEQQVAQEGNSLLARLGVSGSRIDFNTNTAVAKYDRTTLSGNDARTMSDRFKTIRLASGQMMGSSQMPESAPLIFPDLDRAIAKQGEETFKDKAKDAKKFLADYMDRRSQMQYAQEDPDSALAMPESQRAFKSKLADPHHPMYNGGLVGFVSGGALSRGRGRTTSRQDRCSERDGYEMPYGRRGRGGPIGLVGGLIGAATNAGQSREYQNSYDDRLDPYPRGDEGRRRSPFDDRSNAPAPHAPYGGQQHYAQEQRYMGEPRYGAQPGYADYTDRGTEQRRGGLGGGVKRIMQEDVLYLMIVNMPSEAELVEARQTLARASSAR